MEEGDSMNKASTVQKPLPKKKYKARGPTTGIKDKKKEDKKDPKHIDFDEYDIPIGAGKISFGTEIGVLARGIKITYGDWPNVPEGKKETIWLKLKDKFNIEDDSKREVVLKTLGSRYKEFKTRLTRDYIYKKGKKKSREECDEELDEEEELEKDEEDAGLDDDPCEKYGILKEDWEEFVKQRRDPLFKERSEKGRAAQRNNKTPHYMGRSGYAGMTEKWLNEEISSEKLTNPSAEQDDLQATASERLKDRSFKWIKGHTPSLGAPPRKTQEVIDNINHYNSLVKTGEFVPSRLEDVLVKATGKKDHPGRTRGVGSFVGNQKFFGKPPSRAPREKMYTAKEMNTLLEEVKKQSRAEMKNVFIEMAKTCGLILPNAFEYEGASNPSPPREDQTSCHSIDQRDPFVEIKDPISCQLRIYDGNTLIDVAEGTARPWRHNTVVHHAPLSQQNVHVSIDKCLNSTAQLPVPWSGCATVGEAEGSFAQWPKKWVLLGQDEIHSHKKLKRKERSKDTKESRNKDSKIKLLNTDSHLTVSNVGGNVQEKAESIDPYCQQLDRILVSLSMDSIDFVSIYISESVYKSEDVTVYFNSKDIREMFNYESLNITIIQVWGSFLHDHGRSLGVTKAGVGFMCPVQLSSYLYNSRAMEDYVKKVLKTHQDKRYVMGVFYASNYWLLVVICPWDNMAYIFDSNKGQHQHDLKITEHLQLAWKMYSVVAGTRHPHKPNKLKVELIECPQQSGDFECGYYVMKWMYDITVSYSTSQESLIECVSKSRMMTEDMDQVREFWSQKFIEAM